MAQAFHNVLNSAVGWIRQPAHGLDGARAHAPIDASVESKTIRAALLLAMDNPGNSLPDFLWTFDQDTKDSTVWHPDPELERNLDKQALTKTLQELLNDTTPECIAATIQTGLSGNRLVRNIELPVRVNGQKFWWQMAATTLGCQTAQPDKWIGLVRDVTPAHRFLKSLAVDQRHHEEVNAASQQLASALSASLRQHANVVTNICQMLPEEFPQQSRAMIELMEPGFASDMQTAINELLMTASLMRDYTNALTGSLVCTPQTHHFRDAIAHCLASAAERIRPLEFTVIEKVAPHDCIINADVHRLRIAIMVVANLAVCHAFPGGTILFQAGVVNNREARLEIFYVGRPAFNGTETESHDPRMGILHPAIAKRFLNAVIAAHGGILEFTQHGEGKQVVRIKLPVEPA